MSATVPQNHAPGLPTQIGRYRVIERIGKGSMGVVYSAHDDVMGRDVAVKVMMTDLEGEPDIRARFVREAQVSAKLAHPNIVTVYDIDEEDGRLFIVMELLRGQTLAECLRHRTLTIEEKIDLILQVCEGLAVASGAGVCHRDVKPGNLFLKADGGVKILDFGIARLASSSMTASGYIVGTPDYMSPEQARGGAIDERSDIFSVGAVLYLLLARRKPFVAPDLPAVLHKVVWEEAPPISPEAAPPALSRIVFKALAKDPNLRFQKFQELSRELTDWRRVYEGETRTLAAEAARRMDALADLAAEERTAAAALSAPPESDLDAWLSGIAAGYSELHTNGTDALRFDPWHRHDVDEIHARIDAVMSTWAPRIDTLRAAGEDLATAKRQLEGGDARGALAGLESVLRQVPSAGIQSLSEHARQILAEQQARDDRVTSLLREAADASANRRYDAAATLAREAVGVDPQSPEAREFLSRAEQDVRAAEAEKARQCERCLDRARRAMQLEQFEEAERQLQMARETGAAHPDISVVGAAIAEARTARDQADAVIQEIAGELARARGEFQEGGRPAALARLEALASRHPSSTAARAELVRLRAEDERLSAVERTSREAEQLAADAAEALAKNDEVTAARLAQEALKRVPSHELALRTAAVANARQRERAERTERRDRARRTVENAQTLLARGRFDRAIKEARRASELDPSGSIGPAVIAEAFRRQAEAAAAEIREKEQVKRAGEVRKLLAAAGKALRSKEFSGARALAEQAVAVDPDSGEAKALIAKIATAAALAATALEDETVDLRGSAIDPDATVAFEAASNEWPWRWPVALRLWFRSIYLSVVAWFRLRRDARAVKTVSAKVSPSADPQHKEP